MLHPARVQRDSVQREIKVVVTFGVSDRRDRGLLRSWLNCENWPTIHVCGLSWVYVTSVKSFRNDWATEISLHLLDFTFPLCTCSEPQNSYMIGKEIVIDFIKSVLGKHQIAGVSLTVPVCFVKACGARLLLVLLVQHLDSVWNMPLAKVAETSVSPESGFVVVVVVNIHNP